jgi:hypothetical protein
MALSTARRTASIEGSMPGGRLLVESALGDDDHGQIVDKFLDADTSRPVSSQDRHVLLCRSRESVEPCASSSWAGPDSSASTSVGSFTTAATR